MSTKISNLLTVHISFHRHCCCRLISILFCWSSSCRLVIYSSLIIRWNILLARHSFTLHWIAFSRCNSWTCLRSGIVIAKVVSMVKFRACSSSSSRRSCSSTGGLSWTSFSNLLCTLSSRRNSSAQGVLVLLRILSSGNGVRVIASTLLCSWLMVLHSTKMLLCPWHIRDDLMINCARNIIPIDSVLSVVSRMIPLWNNARRHRSISFSGRHLSIL